MLNGNAIKSSINDVGPHFHLLVNRSRQEIIKLPITRVVVVIVIDLNISDSLGDLLDNLWLFLQQLVQTLFDPLENGVRHTHAQVVLALCVDLLQDPGLDDLQDVVVVKGV